LIHGEVMKEIALLMPHLLRLTSDDLEKFFEATRQIHSLTHGYTLSAHEPEPEQDTQEVYEIPVEALEPAAPTRESTASRVRKALVDVLAQADKPMKAKQLLPLVQEKCPDASLTLTHLYNSRHHLDKVGVEIELTLYGWLLKHKPVEVTQASESEEPQDTVSLYVRQRCVEILKKLDGTPIRFDDLRSGIKLEARKQKVGFNITKIAFKSAWVWLTANHGTHKPDGWFVGGLQGHDYWYDKNGSCAPE